MPQSIRGDKSICLPVAIEAEYKAIANDNNTFRQYISQLLDQYPEIFPVEVKKGFSFHDWVISSKQQLPMRRIKLKENREVYQLRPDFVMPYMIGKTDEMEKALYLCQFGVPFEAIAYAFGRNAMYWYRAYCGLSRASLVGTTIKSIEKMPQHLLADEKHTWLQGERVFVPTTVANGCILGVSLTDSASPTALTEGYREFKEEIDLIYPDYQPITANTDGWEATRQAWRTLFPNIVLVLCFLHDVLKVEKGCPTRHNYRKILSGKLWKAYQAKTAVKFLTGLRKALNWAKKRIRKKKTLNRLRKLCRRASQFKVAYRFPKSYRTSNMLDRLMNHQDRLLFNMRYFHGNRESAKQYLRSMALIWNFHPYGARTRSKDPSRHSPFVDLNGWSYHDNWLHNLLIASSMNGRRTGSARSACESRSQLPTHKIR